MTAFRTGEESKPWENPGPSDVFKYNENKGRMQALAQSLKKRHLKDPSLFRWPSDLFLRTLSQCKDGELMHTKKAWAKSFLSTRNTPAPVSPVCNYPRAEVSPDYQRTVFQLCYHLPAVIRTSLCISHLIKISKNEQAVAKRMEGARPVRYNVKAAGAVAPGVTHYWKAPISHDIRASGRNHTRRLSLSYTRQL